MISPLASFAIFFADLLPVFRGGAECIVIPNCQAVSYGMPCDRYTTLTKVTYEARLKHLRLCSTFRILSQDRLPQFADFLLVS